MNYNENENKLIDLEDEDPDLFDVEQDEDDEEKVLSKKQIKKAERKEWKKTLGGKLNYKGKHPLLPEKEVRKQQRFYNKRFVFKWLGYITAIVGLPVVFLAARYNYLFAFLALLVAIPGIFWGVRAALKLRKTALLISLIALSLNVVVLVTSIFYIIRIAPQLSEIGQILKDYFDSIIADFSPSSGTSA